MSDAASRVGSSADAPTNEGRELDAATPSPHVDALMKLYDLATQQRTDWMHFHELAMREPFKAEAEATAFCREVLEIVVAAGVERGHYWRPYVST